MRKSARDVVTKALIATGKKPKEAKKKNSQNKQNVCFTTHTFLSIAFSLSHLALAFKQNFKFVQSCAAAQPELDKPTMRCDGRMKKKIELEEKLESVLKFSANKRGHKKREKEEKNSNNSDTVLMMIPVKCKRQQYQCAVITQQRKMPDFSFFHLICKVE